MGPSSILKVYIRDGSHPCIQELRDIVVTSSAYHEKNYEVNRDNCCSI